MRHCAGRASNTPRQTSYSIRLSLYRCRRRAACARALSRSLSRLNYANHRRMIVGGQICWAIEPAPGHFGARQVGSVCMACRRMIAFLGYRWGWCCLSLLEVNGLDLILVVCGLSIQLFLFHFGHTISFILYNIMASRILGVFINIFSLSIHSARLCGNILYIPLHRREAV